MSNKKLFLEVEHIGIKAYDMEKAIGFYTEVLGFSLINRIKPGNVELVFLKLGQNVVELVEVNDSSRYEDGLVNHLALKVSDIFAAAELIKAKGAELITEEPMLIGEGHYNFFFRGPSGEKLELVQSNL